MVEELQRPDPLIFNENITENRSIFEQEFDTLLLTLLLLMGTNHIEHKHSFSSTSRVLKSWSRTQTVLCSCTGGESSRWKWQHYHKPAESREDPDSLKRKFHEICVLHTSVTMERHKFNMRSQKPGETFESYIRDLRLKVKSCNCGALHTKKAYSWSISLWST